MSGILPIIFVGTHSYIRNHPIKPMRRYYIRVGQANISDPHKYYKLNPELNPTRSFQKSFYSINMTK